MIREILQKVQDHEISVSKAMELLGKDPYSPVEAKATLVNMVPTERFVAMKDVESILSRASSEYEKRYAEGILRMTKEKEFIAPIPKATAPASLVDDVRKVFSEALMIYEMRSRPDGLNPPTKEQDKWLYCYQTARVLEAGVIEILEEYRPTESDGGLVEELKSYCDGRGVCDCRRILEILRKHDKGGRV